jgi:hypothetical protein
MASLWWTELTTDAEAEAQNCTAAGKGVHAGVGRESGHRLPLRWCSVRNALFDLRIGVEYWGLNLWNEGHLRQPAFITASRSVVSFIADRINKIVIPSEAQ